MATTKMAAAETKTAKTFSVSLRDASGAVLRVKASKTARGWRTEVQHRTGTGKAGKVVRGATAEHTTEAAARAAVEAAAKAAEGRGWERRAFVPHVRQPDAFDLAHLPAATKPAKK